MRERVTGWVKRVMAWPIVAHWVRTIERFNGRLGRQFAGAITYFSVLAMVPILMVAFAGVGMTVTVINPDLLDSFKDAITGIFSGASDATAGLGGTAGGSDAADLGEQLNDLVDQAFNSWQTVGLVGLPAALWVGSGWVRNVRAAVRAQIRNDFDDQEKTNYFVALALNIGVLLGFLLLLGLTTALSSIAVSLRHMVATWFPAAASWVGSWGYTAATLVGTMASGFLLFCFLFWTLPDPHVTGAQLAKAGAMGAVGMAALQYAAGILVGVFSRNAAAAVFGSTIVLMLFFNLLATLILIIAAWIGTEDVPEPSAIEEIAAMDHYPTTYVTKLLATRLMDENRRGTPAPSEARTRATGVGFGVGAAAMALLASIAAVISGFRGR